MKADPRFGKLLLRSGSRADHGDGVSGPRKSSRAAPPVAVLNYRTWQRLGRESKIVGEFLRVNGTECQVVGVAPKGFSGVTFLGPDLWLPLGCFRTTSTFARFRPDWEAGARWQSDGSRRVWTCRSPRHNCKLCSRLPTAMSQGQILVPRLDQSPPARARQIAGDIVQDRRGGHHQSGSDDRVRAHPGDRLPEPGEHADRAGDRAAP